MKTGIDVSNHQGKIDWSSVKGKIDFAMIRAGYSTTADLMFEANASMCKKHGVPFGVYWASYALNEKDAEREAETCLNVIRQYPPTLWIAFDYEEFSEKYARTKGVVPTEKLVCGIVAAFLEKIKKAGYNSMLYTNVDFINRYYGKIIHDYPLWLAQWGVSKPKYSCELWQMTDKGKIAGINGNVDLDIMYDDFPEDVDKLFRNKYTRIAEEIIAGKYGNGDERKKKLKSANIDIELAQALVNTMV